MGTRRLLSLDAVNRNFVVGIRFRVECQVNARVFRESLIVPSLRVEEDLSLVVAAIGAEKEIPIPRKKIAPIRLIAVIVALESHAAGECQVSSISGLQPLNPVSPVYRRGQVFRGLNLVETTEIIKRKER